MPWRRGDQAQSHELKNRSPIRLTKEINVAFSQNFATLLGFSRCNPISPNIQNLIVKTQALSTKTNAVYAQNLGCV